MNRTNPRWIALQVILQLLDHGRSLDEIFSGEWYQSLQADSRDLALSRELAFGLCRWYFELLPLLQSRLQKPLRARDRDIEIILLLGLYQLLIMRTEDHAAVNESVNLAQARKKAWARGLINAVLRGVIRERVEADSLDPGRAYPQWMLNRIERDWEAQAEQVLSHGSARPPMTLRVDLNQRSRAEVLADLSATGAAARAQDSSAGAVILDKPCDVADLPGFASGIVSVQDAAAQLAAELLVCAPGARVLDACAAPGGKSAHLLQVWAGIELDALDVNAARMQRLEQNLQRIGQSARLVVGDAASPGDWFDGREYDAILADVPCSGSGVIRRHPDIKLLRRESDIMPLVERQQLILEGLWQLLKPGGKMLYSTCSIFKDENELQIARFLQRHSDCVDCELEHANWGQVRSPGRQILPGPENMDGFYYALLQKTSDQ